MSSKSDFKIMSLKSDFELKIYSNSWFLVDLEIWWILKSINQEFDLKVSKVEKKNSPPEIKLVFFRTIRPTKM